MDAMDILGGLLGASRGKSGGRSGGGGGGLGGKILKDILTGGSRSNAAPPTQNPAPGGTSNSRGSQGGLGSGSAGRIDIQQEASALEDLLNVADRGFPERGTRQGQGRFPAGNPGNPNTQNSGAATPTGQIPNRNYPGGGKTYQRPTPIPQPQPHARNQNDHGTLDRGPLNPGQLGGGQLGGGQLGGGLSDRDCQNQRAIVLIRAMINAAKSDGRVTQEEQQAVLQQLGDGSPEAIQFLRDEFNHPLDVREFAWSVPLGMEQQVYLMSLASIDLDTQAEAGYLQDLAHGLRLPPEICNELHRRQGAPTIF